MAKGIVKWFHRKKGYGFIISDKGEDVFVHYTTIQGDGFRFLNDGETVEYEAEKAAKGLKATAVTRLNQLQTSDSATGTQIPTIEE
ncbi:MAG: cold shock domain-containing protein [Candidatus Omnitrophica bacterium]|nr:cold shock domain-containing protein [Candidatus Omnitrophota bacterium]